MTQKATVELSSFPAAGSAESALMAWKLLGPLRPGEVRVVSLDASDERLLACAHDALNSAERARAEAFRGDSSRSRTARREFIVGRGWLRLLLAASAPGGIASANLPIATSSYGKPYVDCSVVRLPEFNVAHSHGQVVIALAQAGPVGIDLEFVDAAVEVLDIARDSFAPAEVAAIERATAGNDQLDAFYRCWTAKEAIAKADGRGLGLALNSFSLPQDGVGPVSIPGQEQTAKRDYFVRPLLCAPGYCAALATGFQELFCSGWRIDSYDGLTRFRATTVEECTTSAPSGDLCPVTEGAIRLPSCGIALESSTLYG